MNGIVTLKRMLVGALVVLPMSVAASYRIAPMTVEVTVRAPPPCVINNERPIEVEFNDVMTTRVGGDNYKMPVNYTVSCSADTSNALKLQIKGNGATFDKSVLQTNKTGLGIELRHGNGKLAVNSWLKFNYPNKPELWAIPVKQAGETLTGGEFSAGATMVIDYQ